MRNLTKTLAVVSLLAPTGGYALGIGGIKLHSALNQNLNAEISLVVSASENASDIKVSLAPPDKFDEAGVPWASFLSKIKFTTVVGANGSVVIKLSSNEAVKEPLLDFLLEVSWPKGNLYREFTVLVDPPDMYEQATIPVVTNYRSYEPQQKITPQHVELQSRQTEPENNTDGASEYGPTRRNDTLWKIAERAGRQEGVSVEQMMIALYKENPRAFYQENMNVLLTGKTLKIPEREVVLKFSRKQALAELNRQTAAWKNHLKQSQVETTSTVKTVNTDKDTVDNQLKLIAPAEAAISEKVDVAPENEVEAASGNEQVTTEKTVPDELSTPSEITEKDAGVAIQVNEALQDKVAELEKQLVTMQQIIALKDQQLANMQNKLQAKPGVQSQEIEATSDLAEIDATLVQQKPAQPVVKQPVQSEYQKGAFLDPYYLWVGGIGTLTLTLLGWVWWRKRKIDEETGIQSSFVASNIGDAHENEGNFTPSLNQNNAAFDADGVGESSFLSEITFAGLDTFDATQNEIDPVSEADVYLAYGRYEQAEELMRDTLKEQPDRDECKLKLLEIFYTREDKLAFETYASELAETDKKDDVVFWSKVIEMGSDICPDSILFSSEEDQFSAEKNTISEKRQANIAEADGVKAIPVADIKKADFDVTAANGLFHNEAVKEATEAAGGLLNIDPISFEDDILDDYTFNDELKNNEFIDFDPDLLTDFAESDKGNEEVSWKPQENAPKDEFESFEFNLSEKDVKGKESDNIGLSVVKVVDEGFQSMDLLSDKPVALNDSISNDALKDHFDFDMPEAGLYGEDSELTDMDELETKLDLAMAYIDMNDADAAKDIIGEVLENGTPEQQLTAQKLLERVK